MRNSSHELVSSRNLILLLKSCAKQKDLNIGLKLHANAIAQDLLNRDPFVANTLVDMYAKCGSLTKAQEVFDGLESRDVVSWTVLIRGFTQHGLGEKALHCLDVMQCEGMFPNSITLLCSLKACISLEAIVKGQELHAEAERKCLLEQDNAIGNTLVDMYAKGGVLERAKEVFDKMFIRDVISWTALIAGYIDHEMGEEAFDCFFQMQQEGVAPNSITFSSILKVCAVTGNIDKGKKIHAQIEPADNVDRDIVVGHILVDMYAKCGLLNAAYNCFSKLPTRNLVAWTTLISGYADYGQDQEAIRSFDCMQAEGVKPDSINLASCLKACGNVKTLSKGQVLHAEVERMGFIVKDSFIGTTLVNMYAKCGLLLKAQEVFDNLQVQEAAAWTVLIAAYIDHGYDEKALICYDNMHLEGLLPSSVTVSHSLKACGNLRATDKGKQMHADVEKIGLFEGELAVGIALIEMYMQFRMANEACQVFDKLLIRNVAAWNSIIAGLVVNEYYDDVFTFLECMWLEGVPPDACTYICNLKFYGSMGAICNVEVVHSDIEKRGLMGNDLLLGNALVDGYAKCGLPAIGQTIFMRLPSKPTLSWNVLITGFSENGLADEVLENLEQMQHMNIPADTVTFICALKACVQLENIRKGVELHAEIGRQELLEELALGNSLVDMYGKFGLLGMAKEVFLGLPQKDVISWTALIAGYAENGRGQEALFVGEQMQCCGVEPNDVTYTCILRACANEEVIDKGPVVHCEVERKELTKKNVALGNALIDFYAKTGLMNRAQEVFDRLPVKYTFLWSTLIAGYAENGHPQKVLKLLEHMQIQKLSPDAHVFASCLMACGMLEDLETGQRIHSDLVKRAFVEESDVIGNALVDMYAKCSSIASAQQVFHRLPIRDIVTWNALVAGYAGHGQGESCITCLDEMLVEGLIPSDITFIGILKACSTFHLIQKGEDIHSLLARTALFDRNIVLENSVLSMYAKCGMLKKAKDVFDSLSAPNVVSWTALITGYVEHDFGREALKCYEQMQFRSISPNFVTHICVLKACCSIGAIEEGRQLHSEIEKKGLSEGERVHNTLVHMYSKCGLVNEALTVFDKLPVGNEVSWNALMAGYSKQGEDTIVFKLFNRMLQTGLRPSMVTFVIVMTACSRNCLDQCCISYYHIMTKCHGVCLSVKHMANIVNLLCRVGQMEHAVDFATKMPFLPNIAVWHSMLTASRVSGNIRWGTQICHRVFDLRKDPSAGALVSQTVQASTVTSNICASPLSN